MTVGELIEKLQTLDPSLEVFVNGYKGGYEDVNTEFEIRTFRKNINTEWYYGPHEQDYSGDVKGIVL